MHENKRPIGLGHERRLTSGWRTEIWSGGCNVYLQKQNATTKEDGYLMTAAYSDVGKTSFSPPKILWRLMMTNGEAGAQDSSVKQCRTMDERKSCRWFHSDITLRQLASESCHIQNPKTKRPGTCTQVFTIKQTRTSWKTSETFRHCYRW